ncbi:MAG: hypothetical protein Q4F31_04845 [Eubacteriales bacterium]|nr:hypothetical protein [Eubacteriales bacterium]
MKIKHHAKTISLPDYLTKYSDLRTSLSDFYVKTRNCKIIGIADEAISGKGFLLADMGAVTEVLFIAAENDNASVKKALLNYLKGKLPAGSTIQWRIVDNPVNETLALEYGFRCGNTLNIFHSVDRDNEQADKILQDYDKLYTFMERRGYRTVSFDELSEDELLQIRNNPDGEFDSYLRPGALMDDKLGGFSGKLSSASIRDGKVAAYTIIRNSDGNVCIFEIICVAESERKNGTFILPFLRSFREMKDSGAKSALFAVYDTNSEMLKIVKKRFSGLIASQSIQHNMVYLVR